MSATRILRRREWKLRAKSAAPYHNFLISTGMRHPTFQKGIRARRKASGHRPTSTDMHRFEGR